MVIPMSHWSLIKSELVLINDETFEIIDRYELKGGQDEKSIENTESSIGMFSEIDGPLPRRIIRDRLKVNLGKF